MSLILGVISNRASRERIASLDWLNLPLIDQPSQLSEPIQLVSQLESGHFVVIVSPSDISLQATGKKPPGAIKVDFVGGKNRHRRLFGGGKNQLIAKAVGIKPGIRPRVLDLTAGLGEDAFVLASLGCAVTMVERSPIVYALLNDGLQRVQADSDADLLAVANRLKAVHQDGYEYLNHTSDPFDVIYLDPMFPQQEKTAAVNKAMSSFKKIVGQDGDAGTLLKAALATNAKRIVIKRPRKGLAISEQYPDLILPKASLQLSAKSSRYDVYPITSLSGIAG